MHKNRKEGKVLFNDTLNTFCLQLYSIRNSVKDHSDSQIMNTEKLVEAYVAYTVLKKYFNTGVCHYSYMASDIL